MNIKLMSKLTSKKMLRILNKINAMSKISALLKSRRFWISVGGLAASVAAVYSKVDPMMIQNGVLLIAGWVVGDSIRNTK